LPDQLSQSNSNEEEIDTEPSEKLDARRKSTSKAVSHTADETTTRKYTYAEHFRQKNHQANSTTTVTAAQSNDTLESPTSRPPVVDHFRHSARTTTGNGSHEVVATTTHKPSAADYLRHNTHHPLSTMTDERIPLQAEDTKNIEETYVSRFSTSRPQSTPVSETYSRVNPRNNSRFLKNPEPAYKFQQQQHQQLQQQQKRKDPFRIHVTLRTPTSKHAESPVFMIQRANESGFEVQIRHVNDTARSREKSGVTALQRGRKKFSDSLQEEAAGDTAAYLIADQQGNLGLLESRRSRTQYSNPTTTTRYSLGETTTRRAAAPPRARNRGSIKAQNSLSKTEIKELTNLVDTPSAKGTSYRQRRPINKIEETYYDVTPKFTPRHRVESTFIPLTHTNNFGYSKLYTLPNDELNDRYDPEPSFNYYFFNNALQTEPAEVDPAPKDLFRVSETRNLNEGARHLYTVAEKYGTTSPDKPSSTQATVSSSEVWISVY